MSYFNGLRTSIGDVPWHYTEDHIGTSIGRLLGVSSGRPQNLILPSGWAHKYHMYNVQIAIINLSCLFYFIKNLSTYLALELS